MEKIMNMENDVGGDAVEGPVDCVSRDVDKSRNFQMYQWS